MPLRFRIALAIAVMGSLLVAAVLWTTLTNSIQGVRQQLRASEQAIMDLVADLSREALLTEEFGNLQAYVERASRHPRLHAIVVANTRDQIVVATDTALIGGSLGIPEGPDGNLWRSRSVHGRANQLGRLAIEFSDRPYVEAHENALNLGLIVAGIGIAASACVGLLIGQPLISIALAGVADSMSTRSAIWARDARRPVSRPSRA